MPRHQGEERIRLAKDTYERGGVLSWELSGTATGPTTGTERTIQFYTT